MDQDEEKSKRERDLLVARLLVTLISVVFIGLGLFSIFSQHYYGYTSKYGGHEVILDGTAADIWAGLCLISGLFVIFI
jgi:hypothetical protein